MRISLEAANKAIEFRNIHNSKMRSSQLLRFQSELALQENAFADTIHANGLQQAISIYSCRANKEIAASSLKPLVSISKV